MKVGIKITQTINQCKSLQISFKTFKYTYPEVEKLVI